MNHLKGETYVYNEGRRVFYHFWGSRSYSCLLQGEILLRTIKAIYQFCSSLFFSDGS